MLGTANLFGVVDDGRSRTVVHAALDAGFTSVDTAPSYGHGSTEAAIGRLLAGVDGVRVTTKVGLEATAAPTAALRLAKAAARRLPTGVQDRLRPTRRAAEGRFSTAAVRSSVERSLRRVGRVDLLLLHEVTPEEVTEALLGELERFVSSGDVGGVGVATRNELTAPCLARGHHLLSGANVSVAPDERLPPVPVATLVGHGPLGARALVLRRLQDRLSIDPGAADRWREVVAGTPWAGPDGLAHALFSRASGTGVRGVVVTTSRSDRLPAARAAVESGARLPDCVRALLEALLTGSGAGGGTT